jgi:dihydropteroate synthase
MAGIAARTGAAVIIMHMQGTPANMQRRPVYRDVVGEVADFLQARARFALERGVAHDRIIIDPGFGFGKTKEHNLALLRRLEEFTALGYPIAIGISRKGFIGHITGAAVPRERLAGSLAGVGWAFCNGAAVLRVHDVRETVQALAVPREIMRAEWN